MAVILRTAALLTGANFPEPGFTSLWWAPQTPGGSTADATDCLARFRAFWETIKGEIATGVSVDFDPICICVEDSTGVLQAAFAGTDPTTVVSNGAGDGLPRQTQGLVRLSTSTVVGGRRLRGRLFIPCPLEVRNTAGGQVDAAYVTAVTTAAAALNTAGATTSMPRVWHRPTGGAGGSSAAVTSYATSTSWSVLRSRR